MAEVQPPLRRLIGMLVEHEPTIDLRASLSDETVMLHVRVPKTDMGRVIGSGGSYAHAMRNILKAAGSKYRVRFALNIEEAGASS